MIVDDQWEELFGLVKWSVNRDGYAYVYTENDKKERTYEYVHRIIIDALPGQIVDHRNNDRSDNRLENLRIVDKFQNARNSKKRQGTKCFYKGVTKNRNHSFQARIKIGDKYKNLGFYKTEKEAGDAYNKAAKHFFGDHAHLNDLTDNIGINSFMLSMLKEW